MPAAPVSPSPTPEEAAPDESRSRVIAIVGPTAVGKSALALDLAEAFAAEGAPGEIINADALQAYRGLAIGTAKPTAEEQRRVPHHLIDILDPEERYSAGQFAERARSAVREIEGRGGTPLVVGGSGLYFRALFSGLSPIPPGDPAVRAELEERLEREGLDALREDLLAVDPATAERLGAGDTQRVLRALEVARVSGRPLSEWIARQPFGSRELPVTAVGLTLPRSILYDRIESRVARMLEAGWIDEVKELMERGISPESPAFQAIGYRQIAGFLKGLMSRDEALVDIARATRRFAKRQLTWFRKEASVRWFEIGKDDEGPLVSQVFDYIREYR